MFDRSGLEAEATRVIGSIEENALSDSRSIDKYDLIILARAIIDEVEAGQ